MAVHSKEKKKLLNWYKQNFRKLPWRETKNPYFIWLSEVMLQQTTVKAVIPYYEKFIKNFPTVKSLASAPLEKVYENWAGLGYYSRARNLHKAAAIISENGFPKTFLKLLELPGFGPYTARAVASFAYNENVGVVDGNVIRFLCRYHALEIPWWDNKYRKELQMLADDFVANEDASIMNQALIEVGATICTNTSPSCLICPMQTSCKSFQNNLQEKLPLKKVRKNQEIWIWEVNIIQNKKRLGLVLNDYAPFLKGTLIFPGTVKSSKRPPKVYHYKHFITHHEIYVKMNKPTSQVTTSKKGKLQWHLKEDIKKVNPASLLTKALKYIS